jgi:lambda family phage tail tape measure protein
MASLKYTVDVDTKGAKSSIASLERSIGGLGATIGSAFAAGALVGFADELVSLQNRLRAFSSTQAEANARFEQIAGIAGRTRSSLSDIGNLYTKMALASQELGYSQEQVGQITETFAKSLKVGGANAASTASAILQFSQAMGSGVFRGEEFNAVMEASSSTMQDLAKALGVPFGQLRQLAKEGKLTSKIVGDALLRMQDDVENKFAKTTSTVGEAFTNLRTAAGIALTELGTEPGPAQVFLQAAQAVIELTNNVNALAGTLKTIIGFSANLAIIWLGLYKGPQLAVGAMNLLGGSLKAVTASATGFGLVFAKSMSSIKNSLVGIGSAFGIFDKSRGAIMKTATSLSGFSGIVARISQVFLSLGNILRAVFSIGLRFLGWVGIFLAVIDVINFLAKSLFGAKKDVIDLGAVFNFLIDVVKVAWYLLKELGSFIGRVLSPVLNGIGSMIGFVARKFLEFGVIRTVIGWISSLWGHLSNFWNWLKGKAGITPNAPAAPAAAPPAAAPGAPPILPPATGGGGGGKSPAEIARDQAEALKDVREAILEVTKAYRESSAARLDDLQFQLRSMTMSEDQVELETQRRDIMREQATALADLADKEKEIRESTDLSRRGREEALALIAQQVVAVNEQAAAELAAAESTTQAIQAKNREIERSTRLTELNQQANENRAALQALEDQLTLVGLYGDALEDTTAQIELQQRLREIDVQYQNQLLDLERQRARLGEQRYADELANIQAVRAQSIEAANAQAAAVKKVVDAQRRVDRNDVSVAIGRRLEELRRSVDPAVTAVETLDSVFSNMGNAIDSFVETGKFKFADFARSIIADIAKIALKAAATKILTSIFGGMFGVPGLAAGGPTMAGKPYLVGEQGPELFVPNSAGSIMTNASLNKNEGLGQSLQPVVNNTYITNNISAIDSRSVAQMFVENRKSLLGASVMARKEMPYGS